MQILGPRAHVEFVSISRDRARSYCMKERSRLAGPYEYGDVERTGQGNTDLEMADAYPDAWFRYYRGFRDYRTMRAAPRNFPTSLHVLIGETNTGKSCTAYFGSSSHYSRSLTTWFKYYRGFRYYYAQYQTSRECWTLSVRALF